MGRRPGWLLLLALVAGGCSGADSTDQLRTLCAEHLNVSERICECIADRAATELSDEGRELVVAMLGSDDQRAEELRGELELAEITRAASFMANAPARCAANQSGGGS